ncbi:PsbP-related protein [Aeromicrobium alkaliterrae]|uniref:PsbP C-terminal domain-containing protein n=1 Tax=Aeromicrobium alkaliterrae TaxID=302168 RepID=A0ABP4W2U3_9ACTN
MTSRRLLPVLLALAAALLVGCGSDDGGEERPVPSQNRGSDERPVPEGDRVGTDDFTFALPAGWVETSSQVPEAELAFSATEPSGDIANNINVMKSRGSGLDAEEATEAAVAELEASSSFEDVEALDPYDVDGTEAGSITSIATVQGKTYAARQYFLERGGNRYGITFSFGLETSEADMAKVAEQVLDSWTWE